MRRDVEDPSAETLAIDPPPVAAASLAAGDAFRGLARRPWQSDAVGDGPGRVTWTELVAALRQDIAERRAEPVSAVTPPTGVESAGPAIARNGTPAPADGSPAATVKPVQDEWGFFDPEQCGFAALVARLKDRPVDAPGGQ